MEMNMHPALPMQTSGGTCFNDSKVYEPYYSPWPILPNPLEDFPRSPDHFSVSTSSHFLANSLEIHTNLMDSQNGQSDISTFPLGLHTDFHFSSSSPGEPSTQNAAFISQPLGDEAHFPPNQSPCLDITSVGHINHQEEDNHYSWNDGQFQDLPDFPEGISENGTKEIEWKESAGDLCPASLESNWNEFLADPNMGNQLSEVPQLSSDVIVNQRHTQQQHPCLPSRGVPTTANPSTSAPSSSDVIVHQQQTQQHLSLSSREVSITTNPSTPAQSNKARMRWTQELHEAFVDAVNHLGGCERAKPKAVLDHMNVEGLHLQHVKSHLQKYRNARLKPESSEGNLRERTTATERVSSVELRTNAAITEALRMQMDVQKQLHEQLEIQRKLQLKIEEQGKFLLQMLENQNKAEQEKLPLPYNSSDPGNSGTSGLDQLQVAEEKGTGNGDVHSGAGGSTPPSKRAKLD